MVPVPGVDPIDRGVYARRKGEPVTGRRMLSRVIVSASVAVVVGSLFVHNFALHDQTHGLAFPPLLLYMFMLAPIIIADLSCSTALS